MSEFKPIASATDIDMDVARNAFRNTSMDPERRGQSARQDYADCVNAFHKKMWDLARSPAQKAVLSDEIERYKNGFLNNYLAYLTAHAKCASTMVTGPANFPVARAMKANDAADRRVRDLNEWRERAEKAILGKILDARSAQEVIADRFRELEKDIKSSLAAIREIDEEKAPYTRSSFVNSIVGKVERLADSGETELVEACQGLVREYNAKKKKPAITARHKFWKLLDQAHVARRRHDDTLRAEPSLICEKDGIRIVSNPALDRVQIFFPKKPDEATRQKLAGAGWHWSRWEEAWQRKLTNAAIHNARHLVGMLETAS